MGLEEDDGVGMCEPLEETDCGREENGLLEDSGDPEVSDKLYGRPDVVHRFADDGEN